MKVKPLYIYLAVFVVFIIGLVIFSSNNSIQPTSFHGNMPDDDIHRGMEGNSPNNSNLLESAKKQLEDAKSDYEKNPNDTLKTRIYADFLTMAHQPEKAAELYNKILQVDPKRIDALLQLTFIYFNEGDVEKADDYTQRILKIENNHELALYNSGVIQHAKGDLENAKRIWESIIKKFPNSTIAHIAEQSIQGLSNPNH